MNLQTNNQTAILKLHSSNVPHCLMLYQADDSYFS